MDSSCVSGGRLAGSRVSMGYRLQGTGDSQQHHWGTEACLTRLKSMTYYPTMPKAKIAVTLESGLLDEVDALVQQRRFANRSQAIESAVSEQVVRLKRT